MAGKGKRREDVFGFDNDLYTASGTRIKPIVGSFELVKNKLEKGEKKFQVFLNKTGRLNPLREYRSPSGVVLNKGPTRFTFNPKGRHSRRSKHDSNRSEEVGGGRKRKTHKKHRVKKRKTYRRN
jgi:hypothetical protein